MVTDTVMVGGEDAAWLSETSRLAMGFGPLGPSVSAMVEQLEILPMNKEDRDETMYMVKVTTRRMTPSGKRKLAGGERRVAIKLDKTRWCAGQNEDVIVLTKQAAT